MSPCSYSLLITSTAPYLAPKPLNGLVIQKDYTFLFATVPIVHIQTNQEKRLRHFQILEKF